MTASRKPGTIVIDTTQNFLYLVEQNGKARRYGVGTGKPGFEWAGTHKITSKTRMAGLASAGRNDRARERQGPLPAGLHGRRHRRTRSAPARSISARPLYRIHGTNQPWTIGGAVSSGCIRMRNEDVVDLYERVAVGTSVVVM